MLNRDPDARHEVGNDENDVLGNLRPSNRTHSTQERTDQNTREADENTDFKRNTGDQTGRNETHTVNLCHHVGEGAQDGRDDTQEAGQIAAIASTQEIGNRELAKLTQVRC